MKCCYCKSWSMCFDAKPYYNECKSVCPLEEKEAELDNVSQGLAKDLAKDGDAISRQAAINVASGFCHPANIADELAKLPSVNPQDCDTCEVGNPCLYCKHEFEPQESEDKE